MKSPVLLTSFLLAAQLALVTLAPPFSEGAATGRLAGAEQSANGAISLDAVRKHVVELADDSYEGRGAGYAGERKAAEYIVRQFQQIGLSPVGDSVNARKSFFQEFRFDPQKPPIPWQVLTSRNVAGFLEGSDPILSQQVVVLGAHYDGQGRLGQADADRIVPTGAKLKHQIWNSADESHKNRPA